MVAAAVPRLRALCCRRPPTCSSSRPTALGARKAFGESVAPGFSGCGRLARRAASVVAWAVRSLPWSAHLRRRDAPHHGTPRSVTTLLPSFVSGAAGRSRVRAMRRSPGSSSTCRQPRGPQARARRHWSWRETRCSTIRSSSRSRSFARVNAPTSRSLALGSPASSCHRRPSGTRDRRAHSRALAPDETVELWRREGRKNLERVDIPTQAAHHFRRDGLNRLPRRCGFDRDGAREVHVGDERAGRGWAQASAWGARST